jgi:biofilm PGA synthesis N-glycosyltransferase PgaC
VTPGGSIALDTVPTGGDVAIVSRLFDNSRILSFIIIGIGAGIIIVLKARKDKSAKKRMAGGGKMASPIHESHGYVRPIIPVCVLIPAYNEEGFIGETLESLMDQTVCPKNIIVIDDCSTDRTTEIAKSFGVTVTRTRANTGSKANALNYGMIIVDTKYTVTIDADMRLESKALEEMFNLMNSNEDISLASSFILPKQIHNIWERSRFVEYMLSFSLLKKVQDLYNMIVISTGSFAMYRTEDLKLAGGWSNRTKAEDMDLTWTFHEEGKKIALNQDAFCYASEPGSFNLWRKQVTRWNVGYFEVVSFHMAHLKKLPVLREFVFMAIADAIVGTAVFIGICVYVASSLNFTAFLYYLLLDVSLTILVPLYKSVHTNNVQKLLTCLPAYYIVHFLGIYFMLYGLTKVFVLRQTMPQFEKGH